MSEQLTIFIPASFAIGYMLGAVPFGLVLVYLATGQDIRTIGSGNIGATNVLRTGHKGLALLTLVLDALKGAIAYFISQFLAVTRQCRLCRIWGCYRPLFSAMAEIQGRQRCGHRHGCDCRYLASGRACDGRQLAADRCDYAAVLFYLRCSAFWRRA